MLPRVPRGGGGGSSVDTPPRSRSLPPTVTDIAPPVPKPGMLGPQGKKVLSRRPMLPPMRPKIRPRSGSRSRPTTPSAGSKTRMRVLTSLPPATTVNDAPAVIQDGENEKPMSGNPHPSFTLSFSLSLSLSLCPVAFSFYAQLSEFLPVVVNLCRRKPV